MSCTSRKVSSSFMFFNCTLRFGVGRTSTDVLRRRMTEKERAALLEARRSRTRSSNA